MSKKINFTCNDRIIFLKKLWRENKFIVISGIVSLCLGFLIGISKVKSFCEKGISHNIIVQISECDFNLVFFYIKIVLISAVLFIVPFLFSFNFYVFLLSFPLITGFTAYFTRIAFVSCCLDGVYGFLTLLLFWAPLVLVNWLAVVIYMAKLSEQIGFPCRLCRITPYRCNWNATKKILFRCLLASLLFNLIFCTVWIIILFLIF